MRRLASEWGFNNIRELKNEQATSTNLKKVFDEFITSAVTPNDRVLIYFTGHGSQVPDQNGDEADGLDEVLVLNDTELVSGADGQTTLRNVWVDDEINAMFSRVVAKDIFFIVDACHSGTSASSGGFGTSVKKYTAKRFRYPGMMLPKSRVTSGLLAKGNIRPAANDAAAPERVVLLAAAQDDEESLDAESGSLFTEALEKAAVRFGAKDSSPENLIDSSSKYIETLLNQAGMQVFHPKLTASEDRKRVSLAGVGGDGLSNLQLIRGYVEKGKQFEMSASSKVYQEGGVIRYSLNVPADGYLNVLSVGTEGKVTLLFPNAYQSDNYVKAGKMSLPGDAAKFVLRARKPYGESYIAAFLSEKKVDFFSFSEAARTKGVTLAEPSWNQIKKGLGLLGKYRKTKGAREVVVEPADNDSEYFAAAIATTVCARANGCN